MRHALLLLPVLVLAGCGTVDTSPGASGFADTSTGRPGRTSGVITTGGQIIQDRDLPPTARMPRPY